MIIYKVTNLINGKIYVGQDAFDRQNYYGSGIYIKRAIKKYGIENFKKEILEHYDSKEELDKGEKYWIKKLSAKVPSGYNMTDGGDGTLNPSKEVRRRRSKTLRNNKNAMKKVTELGQSNKGRARTEKTRRAMSEGRRSSKKAMEQAKNQAFKMGKANKGKKPWNKGLTKEVDDRLVKIGKNISEALKGRTISKKWRENISKALKGKSYEERFGEEKGKELRQIRSEAIKGDKNPNKKK